MKMVEDYETVYWRINYLVLIINIRILFDNEKTSRHKVGDIN